MFLSKHYPSRQLCLSLLERLTLTRAGSSHVGPSSSSPTNNNSNQHQSPFSHQSGGHDQPSESGKRYRTPLSLDPDFRAPPDNELPRAKTTEMQGITFDIRDFYKAYFPNDPVEARLPTPWHMDIYYRKQYYIVGIVLGIFFGVYVSIRRIMVDRARQRDWERHHGDPLSYNDIVGPIDPNFPRKIWEDYPALPRPAGWVAKTAHEEEEVLH